MPPRAALLVDPDVLHDYLGAVADPGGAAYAVHQACIGEVGPEELIDPAGVLRKLWPTLDARQKQAARAFLAPYGITLGQPVAPLAVPLVEGGTELVSPAAAAVATTAAALTSKLTGGVTDAVSSYLKLRSIPWWVWLALLYLLFGGRRR